MESMDRQGETIDKIVEIVEAISGKNNNPSVQRENDHITYSNTVIYDLPKGTKGNVGRHDEATQAENVSGDTLGGNKPMKEVYPKNGN